MSATRRSEIAQRLRLLRHRRSVSQEEAAVVAGCSVRTVSAWEAGDTEPSATAIVALADLFDVTSDYLLGRSAYEATLPPQSWIVDLDAIDRARKGLAIPGEPRAAAIPSRHAVLSSTEFQRLMAELDAVAGRASRKPSRKRGR